MLGDSSWCIWRSRVLVWASEMVRSVNERKVVPLRKQILSKQEMQWRKYYWIWIMTRYLEGIEWLTVSKTVNCRKTADTYCHTIHSVRGFIPVYSCTHDRMPYWVPTKYNESDSDWGRYPSCSKFSGIISRDIKRKRSFSKFSRCRFVMTVHYAQWILGNFYASLKYFISSYRSCVCYTVQSILAVSES